MTYKREPLTTPFIRGFALAYALTGSGPVAGLVHGAGVLAGSALVALVTNSWRARKASA